MYIFVGINIGKAIAIMAEAGGLQAYKNPVTLRLASCKVSKTL